MKTTFPSQNGQKFQTSTSIWTKFCLYVNQVCASISADKDKGLTASMVNNYVKHGYLIKPDKKKIPTPTDCPSDCYHNPQVCIFYSRNSTDT